MQRIDFTKLLEGMSRQFKKRSQAFIAAIRNLVALKNFGDMRKT